MAVFFCLLLAKYPLADTLPAYNLFHGSAGEVFFLAIYAAFLLTMFCSDMEQQIIFDKQLALFAIFGLLHSLLFTGAWLQHVSCALLAGLAFLLLAVITRGGIGGGDIKLIAALGLWLNPAALKLTALGGIIIGGIWALLAILLTKKSRKDFIPYGPSFIIAALIAYILYMPAG
ncbi:prepilin peptidase [Anaerovibrio sp.]|uniref:prepilin peptidase n=1 Tax=Anaerovibrio sp. TaxID=1872532 RepID=UPI003F16E8EE